jgi:hypothetical protein
MVTGRKVASTNQSNQEKSMKIGNKLAVLGVAALLSASIGLAQTKTDTTNAGAKAPAPAKSATATTHVMNGTVESVSGTGAAMTVVVKGSKSADKPVTLMLDSKTTKTGDLVQGAKVTAHYHVDNGQNIATSIAVTPAKATTATTKAPSTTPAPAAKK